MKLYELQEIYTPISYKPGVSIHSSSGLCTMLDIKTRFPYNHFELGYKYGSDAYFDIISHKEGIIAHNWITLNQHIESICRENGTRWLPNRQGIELKDAFDRVIIQNLKNYLRRNPKKRDNDWILYGNYNIQIQSSRIRIYRIRAGKIRKIYDQDSKDMTLMNIIDIPDIKRRLNSMIKEMDKKND